MIDVIYKDIKFWEPTYEGGLSDEINRICGTTTAIYSNKAKVARINDALDRYMALAFKSSSAGWPFDDSNQSAPPIQTINLVSGQERYELDDFTSEVLNICRVEILDSDGEDHLLEPISLNEITEPYNDYLETDGIPVEYIKMGKFIDLKPAPNYASTNGLRIYFDRPASRYAFVTCTMATTDLITATAHGLAADDTVIFETDTTIPAGITADTTQYYVISSGLTADAFKVATVKGATTATDITDTGTGNHTFLKTSKEPGIPTIHHLYIARYASLPFLIEKRLPHKNDIAALIQQDEREIMEFLSRREKDTRRKMTMKQRNFK